MMTRQLFLTRTFHTFEFLVQYAVIENPRFRVQNEFMQIIDLNFGNHSETIASFLVETSDGPVLVETGPHSTLPALEAGLSEAGVGLSDVQHVLLTHIHLDHGGAAWVLANEGARVYVHPAGLPHLADPSKLMASATRIYKDDMDRLWGQMHPIAANQLVTVEDRQTVRIGNREFIAHHTPGHAIHHIAWQLEADVFTGDVGGIRINKGPVVPPCPPPDIHIGHWMESIKRLESLNPERLFLTHFGEVKTVSRHLSELKSILMDWALWMKPWAEQDADPSEVTPEFQKYVAGQLRKEGVKGENIERYENANPAWMSVAGLIRYWKKYGNE